MTYPPDPRQPIPVQYMPIFATCPTPVPPEPPRSAGATVLLLCAGAAAGLGTYTTGPVPGQAACTWARLRGTSGQPSDIIETGTPKGHVTVTIEHGDAVFATGGCADWTGQ